MAKFFTPSRLSENIVETPEGFLLCMSVPVARTGWQDYGPGETPLEIGNDGKVWVYRDASEVFRPQTMASFNGKSITIKHPEDFVVPANWKDLTHGTAQNVRKGTEVDEDGEEMLLADLLITDELAIGLVRNGLREVSCGYDAEYEQTGDGEGKQLNIIGNHIALVEQGRAGPTYAIKDHKGKEEIMNEKELKAVQEQLALLGKTVDAALKAKESLNKKKAKASKTGDDEGGKTPEQVTYDDLVKKMADMNEKLDGMMGLKKSDDEDMEDEDEGKKKSDDEDMEDSDEDQEVGQNGRLDKCEAAIAKILKMLGNKKADDEESEEDGDEDMSGDEDMEESEDDSEEMEDEDCEDEEGEEAEESQKKKKTGDEAKFEILTPGKKFKGKDARVKCLKEFAKSDEGSKVLKQLGMKKPVFDAKTNVDMLFMAASALMKSKRGTGLGGTKDSTKWKDEDVDNTASEGKSAEELNEINAKHYGVAK